MSAMPEQALVSDGFGEHVVETAILAFVTVVAAAAGKLAVDKLGKWWDSLE